MAKKKARKRTLADVIAPDLDVLFVGINPGTISARGGHHFANPANAFWRLLYESGFTTRRFRPSEGGELLLSRLGITNLVARESPGVADLRREDFERGRQALRRKIRRYKPKAIVFVGITAYRGFVGDSRAVQYGEQEPVLGARVPVVPNPSGRNAHFPYGAMRELFADAARRVFTSRAS